MWITKKEILEAAARGEGPLGKVADDEPIFVLRAQDSSADDFVEKWAIHYSVRIPAIGPEAGVHKANSARAVAEAMRSWPIRKHAD